MADSDWGWKKRGIMSDEDDHEVPSSLYHNYLMKKARGYKHRPNYGYEMKLYDVNSIYFGGALKEDASCYFKAFFLPFLS